MVGHLKVLNRAYESYGDMSVTESHAGSRKVYRFEDDNTRNRKKK